MIAYVGTYSVRGSEGIYALDFDEESGALGGRRHVAALHNPSFLALHPRGPWLYAVSEQEQGEVAAFALSAGGSAAALLSRQSTLGSAPCHLAVDPTGRWLVSANYGSGSVALHPILPDGALGPPADLARHAGSGPRADRQAGPHAHSVTFDPSGGFIIAADLGADQLLTYALDRERGKLTPHDPPAVALHPGAGPRHFAFHPSGASAYVINELDNTVVACEWEGEKGLLTPRQTLPTLPPEFTGISHCADIRVHPAGRFLYGSNRGHDSLAVFSITPETGLLEGAGHVGSGGRNPRNFALTPDGQWLLAANQDTDNIAVFRLGEDGRRVTPIGDSCSVPAPVCVVFAR